MSAVRKRAKTTPNASAQPVTVTELKTPAQVIDAIRNIGSRDEGDAPIFGVERSLTLRHSFADLDTFATEPDWDRVTVKYEWNEAGDFNSLEIGGSAFTPVTADMWEVQGIETLVALYDCIGEVVRAMVTAGAYTMPLDQKEAWRRAAVRKALEDAAVPATVTKPADADGRKRTRRARKPLRRKAVR